MTYKHLNTQELTFISFLKQGTKAYLAARALRRSAETIYRVYRFLNQENYRSISGTLPSSKD